MSTTIEVANSLSPVSDGTHNDEQVWYNLNGQKVSKEFKGVVVGKSKKVQVRQ